MKKFNWIAGLFALTLLIITVVACGPAQPPSDAATAEGVTAAEGDDAATEPVDESESAVETASADDSAAVDPAQAPPAVPTQETIIVEDALVTDSGLQFVEKVAGDGAQPQTGDIVTMDFSGTLPDGTLFGDSYSQGQPIVAVLGTGQLLPGWEEGIMLMKAGGEAQLIIPPELAFGDQGYGMIPPNSQVVMDVVLLDVSQPPVPTAVSDDDLTTSDSGLQYFDIEVGDGDTAEEGSIVSTDYTIWIRDAEGNDNFVVSSEGQPPLSFELGAGTVVFPGWEEGVTGMQVGGSRLLIIPPEIALGEQGGGSIPPNSTLVMEVTLADMTQPAEMTEVDPDDLVETESGLKYYDIVEGDGATPEQGQVVEVHYSGWLQEDGTKFDSSVDRGETFSFALGTGGVIAGWDEGVATMKVGGKRQLVIPAELAYGENGRPGIPPGATLIFDIELIDIAE